MGKVFKPTEWYNATLATNLTLQNDQVKLVALKSFIDFLEANNLFMSVVGNGRDTKNSSIYNAQSTDKEHWLCDIKFFQNGDFSENLIVVGTEKMNTANEIYENAEFSKTVELITGKLMECTEYSEIKKQITIDDLINGLDVVKKALGIYKIFR